MQSQRGRAETGEYEEKGGRAIEGKRKRRISNTVAGQTNGDADDTGAARPGDPPAAAGEHWWVYLLRCADGSLYAGVARNVERRLRQHNGTLAGGPRYTRGRRPVALLWCESVPDRSAAQRREAAIKRLGRRGKLALADSGVVPPGR